MRKLLIMVSLTTLLTTLSSCFTPRADQGDTWIERLKVGMSKRGVQDAIGRPNRTSLLQSTQYEDFFDWSMEMVPYDLPRKVQQGVELWSYDYWVNSNTKFYLIIFFTSDGRVIGWVKPHSSLSAEKYKHERLTSQLKDGMSQSQIRKRLGEPTSMLPLPEKSSPEIYMDHYWKRDPVLGVRGRPMWVYHYSIAGGGVRKVFLFFNIKDNLLGWGYDRAHEEAERYLREQAKKQ